MKDIEDKEIKLSGRSIEEIQAIIDKRTLIIDDCLSGMDVWKVRINSAFVAGLIMLFLIFYDKLFLYFAILAFVVGSLEHIFFYMGLDKILKEEIEQVYDESMEIELIRNPDFFSKEDDEGD